MTTKTHLDATAIVLIVVLCALWGTNQVAIKLANQGISPVLQAGLRSLGAVVLATAWSWSRGVNLLRRDGSLTAGLIAGLLFAVEFGLLYAALRYTSASRAAIFLYTAPFFVALGSHLALPGERLRAQQLLGLATAFCGVVISLGDRTAATDTSLQGDLLALTAGALWGATTVFIKASPLRRVAADKTLIYQLGVSALILPPVSWLIGEPGIFAPSAAVIGLMAFQIVIVAFATYLVWFWLLKNYPAARVAAFSFLTPVFGVAAGVTIGEPVTISLIAALALVVGGIALVNRK